LNRLLHIAICAALAALLVCAFPAEGRDGGRFIVKTRDEAALSAAADTCGPFAVVDEEELRRLLLSGALEWYEEDTTVTLLSEDAELSGAISPWYSDDMWHLDMIGAAAAYEQGATGAGIRVGVLDSGITPHEDFADRLAEGWNYIDGSADTGDDFGHGTSVAGLIAGRSREGFVGVAPDVTLVPLKCFKQKSSKISNVISGIYGGVDDFGCNILNLSLGFPEDSPALREAIDHAAEMGVLIVASAGNGGSAALSYPSAYDSVLGVGEARNDGSVSLRSNHHKGVYLLAPGEKLTTTYYKGGYTEASGTSFSVPLAVGAAAALWSARPELGAADIMELLGQTATDGGDPGYDEYYGWGILNVRAALEAEKSWTPSAAEGVSMTLVGEGAAVWNKSPSPLDAYLLAVEYDDAGLQSSVGVTPLHLEPGERVVTPIRRGKMRLLLCSSEFIPLAAPLDA
jgi:subtilisin family serine protease